ncbi:MAG: efflux RND transporter periplasmic adaptor subunit [Pseudomonadota bacterium]|nr:efflux RND transporter periplasmic adaptor subunit [Pseudomonadota bacterium]
MTPKRYRKPWLPLALFALGTAITLPTAGLVAARLASGPADNSIKSPALAVSVIRMDRTDGYPLRRVFTGQVEANRASSLGFERAGLLRGVLVKEGDAVNAGQVLARLDQALLGARRNEFEAALNDAEASLSLARSTLRRYRESVDEGAVTRQALDEASKGASAAEAGVDLAGARIASVDVEIAKSELRAPFDGVVTRRLADEGRVLPAGNPLLELQERAVPEIRVGVAGVLADTLKPAATYSLNWRGRSFPARLRAVLPIRALGTRTVDLLFVPIEPPAGLRPGELVELELTDWVDEPGFWLPLSALAEGTRGLWSAYAAEPLTEAPSNNLAADHQIAPRPLEILYQDGDRVFVRGPVNDGEQIVRSGLQRVVPGQLVRVTPDPAEQLALGGH